MAAEPLEAVDDDPDRIRIGLSLAVALCPACAEPAPAGPCPKCGTEVPALEEGEMGKETEARRKALTPLLEKAKGLRARLDEPPVRSVPVTNDQFAACMQDAEVPRQVLTVLKGCKDLAKLDMNDPKEIGVSVRRAIQTVLDLLTVLVRTSEELARLATDGPATELQESMGEAAVTAAEVLISMLGALTATTVPAVETSNKSLQEAFDSFVAPPEELFDRLEEWSVPDVDARIGLVLDKPGTYTDDFGFIQPGLIFSAFAGEAVLFEKVEERAKAYFSHLLPETEIPHGEGALLILAAVTLGSLDRPLLAHRCADEMAKLTEAAFAADPTGVKEVIARTTAEGPRLFAASARIQTGFRLLAMAAQVEEIDDEAAVREVMSSYKELAEAAFRTHARATLDLVALAGGASIDKHAELPTVGQLKQSLDASGSELARAMGAAVDSELRNAAAHAQYRWDGEALEVVKTDSGKRWGIEALEQRVDSLVGSVVGVDAGFCCFAIGHHLADETSGWLRSGEAPQVVELLGTALFAASGYSDVEISDGGATVKVGGANRDDLTSLMTPLGGFSFIVPEAKAYKVVDAEHGDILIDVPEVAIRQARDIAFELKDLAIAIAFYESNCRRGRDQTESALVTLAIMAKVISVTAMTDFVDAKGPSPAVVTKVRERFEFARAFGIAAAASSAEAMKMVKKMERVIAETYKLGQGDRKAFRRLVPQFDSLIAWADEKGLEWPPSVGSP